MIGIHAKNNSVSLSGAPLLAITVKIAVFLLLLLSFTSCKKDKTANPCEGVPLLGSLSKGTNPGDFKFTTSGGGTIEIYNNLQIIIRHNSYPNFKVEFWGSLEIGGLTRTSGNHENLNGKHVKDRVGTRRTVIFPDGAKITLVAAGEQLELTSISIYDGAQSHHINTSACDNFFIDHSSTDAAVALKRDTDEADGETATFEISSTGLIYDNIYTEDVPGTKVMNRVKLGELILSNPTSVHDYYDDPRLGHT